MIRRSAYVLASLALIVCLPYIAIHSVCLFGFGWVTGGVEIFILVPLFALLVFLLALPGIAFDRTRKVSGAVAIVAGGLVALGIPAIILGGQLRHYGFELAAKRAAPLVAALHAYEKDHGAPPKAFEELRPRYLKEVPGRLPEFELITGDRAREDFRGNTWVLVALVSTGVLNWDQFMYFPNQDYPREGYGGWVERIHDWGYVHE